jgi:hypothetical protein
MLAVEYPGLRYANLAVRGKLLRQIVAEQVPAAVAMSPSLVSIAGGGNDILRPNCSTWPSPGCARPAAGC